MAGEQWILQSGRSLQPTPQEAAVFAQIYDGPTGLGTSAARLARLAKDADPHTDPQDTA